MASSPGSAVTIVGTLRARFADATRGKSLRYLMAAGLNTAVGLAAYPVLLWTVPFFRHHYMAALVLVQIGCLCFAYASYKLLVFRTRGGVLGEIARFSSFYLINYAANLVALPVLVEVIGLPPIIAQLSFSGVVMVASFFWHSRITFR